MHIDKIKPIIESIAQTLDKIGEPLTESQLMILYPAIAIWFEKLLKDEK